MESIILDIKCWKDIGRKYVGGNDVSPKDVGKQDNERWCKENKKEVKRLQIRKHLKVTFPIWPWTEGFCKAPKKNLHQNAPNELLCENEKHKIKNPSWVKDKRLYWGRKTPDLFWPLTLLRSNYFVKRWKTSEEKKTQRKEREKMKRKAE